MRKLSNECDKTIQINLTRLYKRMWQVNTNGWDKTIQIDIKKYTNGCEKTKNGRD